MSAGNKKGFTLVEILIALTIVAILAAIAIVSLTSQLLKGRDARRKADLDRIKVAVEEYEKDHNCYPPYVTCGIVQDQPVYYYLNNVPCDPSTNASYYYENDGSTCSPWYRVYAKLEYTQDPEAMAWCGGPGNNSFNFYVSSPNAPTCGAIAGGTAGGGGGGGGGPTPTPSGGLGVGKYYGCSSGVCVPISWDYSRPGPACDPNFPSSNCYNRCGPPSNECVSWKK